MIPRKDIELEVLVLPADELRDPDDAEGSGLWFRDIWDITDVNIGLAREVITTEAALVVIVDRLAPDEATFDEIAACVEGSYIDDLAGVIPDDALEEIRDIVESSGMSPTEGLDLGVAGLVHALSATGHRTEASCRGHPGPGAWSERPIVYFTADRQRRAALLPLVRLAGCGLGAAGGGFFIEARSITATSALARMMLAELATGPESA